jgi:uncharacterized membrane protein (UPF0136 family)
MIKLGQYSILLLTLVVLGGGIMGYIKANSRASLIAGSICAALLSASFAVCLNYTKDGFIAALVVTALLDVIFGIRLAKTKKFMPSGVMLSLCLVEQMLVGYTLNAHLL